MRNKLRLMKVVWRLPLIISIIRCLITLWFIMYNPVDMQLRIFQTVLIILYICYMFSYVKMYSDGVPVITIMLPNIMHIILILIFVHKINIIPFIILIVLDVMFLIFKALKSSLFPFDIDEVNEDYDWITEDNI